VDDRALSYIAKAAEGSMRDAQSLLDQIISFSGQQIVDEDVRDVLGFIPNEVLEKTMDGLADRNSKALLETIGIVIDQGLNAQQYVREVIGRIRDLLVLKLGLEEEIVGTSEERQSLARHASAFSEQDLIRVFDILMRIESELRSTSQLRFHLELGFIKLAKVGYLRDIEEVLREVKGGSGPSQPGIAVRYPAPTAAVSPQRGNEPVHAPEPTCEERPAASESFTFGDILRRRVEGRSAVTAVYLQKAEVIERIGDTIRIVIENGPALAMLQSREHKSVLDAASGELVGKPVSVSLIMKDQQKGQMSVDDAKDEPLVKSFLEVFRGDVAQVKPAKGE
jgi:DNA polymerase-3 subunit gamma/tau